MSKMTMVSKFNITSTGPALTFLEYRNTTLDAGCNKQHTQKLHEVRQADTAQLFNFSA